MNICVVNLKSCILNTYIYKHHRMTKRIITMDKENWKGPKVLTWPPAIWEGIEHFWRNVLHNCSGEGSRGK